MQGLTMAIQMENPHKELGFIPHNTVTAALEQINAMSISCKNTSKSPKSTIPS
jgi:hypothetical protein